MPIGRPQVFLYPIIPYQVRSNTQFCGTSASANAGESRAYPWATSRRYIFLVPPKPTHLFYACALLHMHLINTFCRHWTPYCVDAIQYYVLLWRGRPVSPTSPAHPHASSNPRMEHTLEHVHLHGVLAVVLGWEIYKSKINILLI